MQTDGLKHIKWLSSHRLAYGFSPRIYNCIKLIELLQKDFPKIDFGNTETGFMNLENMNLIGA